MLRSIYIRNFIIIAEMKLDLPEGLISVTGETGSGKSLILDAIDFCINGSGKIPMIHDAGHSMVSLSFDSNEKINKLLEENGIIVENDEIHITRTLYQDGKKRCNINNQPATQKILDLFIEDLITIYAQHSLSKLFKPSSHIRFLDEFTQANQLASDVQKAFRDVKAYKTELLQHQINYENNAREYEFLQHMASEIRAAKIEQNEEEELTNKRILLQSLSKKYQLINDVYENFSKSDITSTIHTIIRQLARAQDNDLFTHIIEELDIAQNHIDNAASELNKLQNYEYSTHSLEEVEERLFAVKALARKYNCASTSLPDLLKDAEGKIASFDNSADIIKSLDRKIQDANTHFLTLAKQLSEQRHEAAKRLMEKVSTELKFLNMGNCNFLVDITKLEEGEYTERGIDSVIYKASTNPGSPYSAIDKIASGGEMARFMLALQLTLLATSNQQPCIIFDEIDTGIGGKVAESVGIRLKKLSELTQVLVITHQPQVASKSANNILVSKESDNVRTISKAKILSPEERVKEIARMLSGEKITEEAIHAAKQLIRH